MKTRILFIIFLSCIYSCCSNKKSELFFVIKPFPPCSETSNYRPAFYGDNNFILYNDSTVYYFHVSYSGGGCGTGLDFCKPTHLRLTPDSLHFISTKDLKYFLKQSIATNNNRKIILSISSPKDTIRGLTLWNIRKYCMQDTNILANIRKSTEEETYVADAKFKKKPYDPLKIKWKFGFDHGMTKVCTPVNE